MIRQQTTLEHNCRAPYSSNHRRTINTADSSFNCSRSQLHDCLPSSHRPSPATTVYHHGTTILFLSTQHRVLLPSAVNSVPCSNFHRWKNSLQQQQLDPTLTAQPIPFLALLAAALPLINTAPPRTALATHHHYLD